MSIKKKNLTIKEKKDIYFNVALNMLNIKNCQPYEYQKIRWSIVCAKSVKELKRIITSVQEKYSGLEKMSKNENHEFYTQTIVKNYKLKNSGKKTKTLYKEKRI